jgi:hypothetical protein
MHDPIMSPAVLVALEAAQKTVKAAVKRTPHTQYGYKYATAEEVVKIGKVALRDAGLLFYLVSAQYEAAPTVTGPESGTGKAIFRYGLSLVATGETGFLVYEVPVCPNKGRPADKAFFAGDTESMAYALRGLLLIARPGADDITGRTEPEPQAPPPPAPRAAPRARSTPWPLPACTPQKLADDMREIASSAASKIQGSSALSEVSALMSSSRQSGLFNWLEARPVFRACADRLRLFIVDASADELDSIGAMLPRLALPDAFANEVKASGLERRTALKVLS